MKNISILKAEAMTGEELRSLRLAHGLTQVQLADLLGYGWRYIGKLENEQKPIAEHLEKHIMLLMESLKKKKMKGNKSP